MKTKVFAVYDAKAETFMQPFHMNTRGMATRAWMDTVNDAKTQFNKHPQDFTLFELGEFDDEKGTFHNHNTPQSVGLAIQYLDQKGNNQ